MSTWYFRWVCNQLTVHCCIWGNSKSLFSITLAPRRWSDTGQNVCLAWSLKGGKCSRLAHFSTRHVYSFTTSDHARSRSRPWCTGVHRPSDRVDISAAIYSWTLWWHLSSSVNTSGTYLWLSSLIILQAYPRNFYTPAEGRQHRP